MGGIKFLGNPAVGPLILGEPAAKIWAGVVRDQRRVGLSPCITVIYQRPVLAAMLFIGREMEQQKLLPRVYCWQQSKSTMYIAVLFQMKQMPITFLQKFASRHVVHAAQKHLGDSFEFIAASEAEIPARDVQPFFKLFERKRYFWLYLSEMDPPRIDPLWRMRLESLSKRAPQIKGEILD